SPRRGSTPWRPGRSIMVDRFLEPKIETLGSSRGNRYEVDIYRQTHSCLVSLFRRILVSLVSAASSTGRYLCASRRFRTYGARRLAESSFARCAHQLSGRLRFHATRWHRRLGLSRSESSGHYWRQNLDRSKLPYGIAGWRSQHPLGWHDRALLPEPGRKHHADAFGGRPAEFPRSRAAPGRCL